MSKWEVGIYSDSRSSFLSNRVLDHNEFRYYEEEHDYGGNYHYIDSECFDHITPENKLEALAIIEGISIIANGSFALCYKDIRKVVSIDFSNIFYDESSISFTDINREYLMNPFIVIPHRQKTLVGLSLGNPFHLITLSRKYDEIREILFQIGSLIDNHNIYRNISAWTLLYAINDTILYYMEKKYKVIGENKILIALGSSASSSSDYKRFTGTANNYNYLGIYSRHGKRAWTPPLNPMNIEEACIFIFNLAQNFFNYANKNSFLEIFDEE